MKSPRVLSLIPTLLPEGEGFNIPLSEGEGLFGQRGFTLLEVLVAFSITALALGVLYQIYVKGTTSALLGKEYAAAVAIAESRLALVGVEPELNDDYLSGIENEKYNWQLIIRDYAYPDTSDTAYEPPLPLKELELKVSWDSQGKQRSFVIHSLRLAPQPL